MCIGTWANGKQCTRPIRKEGACSVHYVNKNQTKRAEGKYQKCPSPEHKCSDSEYLADYVPIEHFMMKSGSETNLRKNCVFCREVTNTKRNRKVKPEDMVKLNGDDTLPYFPVKIRGEDIPYSEIVKCLVSFGFIIQIDETEYLLLKNPNKIPAMCPLKHGIVNVSIDDLKRGSSCCQKCGIEKMKKTNMIKTGYEFPAQNPDTKEKTKVTYSEKTGYTNSMQNPETQVKKKENYLAKTDGKYDHPTQNPEVQEKRKENYLAKTDGKYDNPSKNPEVKEKRKQTFLAKSEGKYTCNLSDPKWREEMLDNYEKKTGYSHPSKNPATQERYKQTNLERTNFEYPMQNPSTQEKWKQTNIERTGFAYPIQNPSTQEKWRQTNIERTGFAYPIQDPKIFAKIMKSRFKYRPYIFPSGNETVVQGYENFCLDDLVLREGIKEEDILNRIEDMPDIRYRFKDEVDNRRYFPDIYIPSQNKIIEIKCPWTFKKDLDKNLAKARACIAQGYNFELRIYDRKGVYTVADI